VASACLFEHASDRSFHRRGVAAARTRIEHNEEGALKRHMLLLCTVRVPISAGAKTLCLTLPPQAAEAS
jgi:hypothetical protein